MIVTKWKKYLKILTDLNYSEAEITNNVLQHLKFQSEINISAIKM
jgi:hypothetical protein